MIAFIQPFGIQSPGGGARILRALLQAAGSPVLSINTSVERSVTPSGEFAVERQISHRPSFGRLERTRLRKFLDKADLFFQGLFRLRLRSALKNNEICKVHIVAHGYECITAFRVATSLGIQCVVSVHDDIGYSMFGHALKHRAVREFGEVWRNCAGRTVISRELGEEYCRRYGNLNYEIITDGLEQIPEQALDRPAETLRLYFMGLFHLRYGQNVRALLDALRLLKIRHPSWRISMVCRCGDLPVPRYDDDVLVSVLPFASESQVELDLLEADVLYQPLPFQPEAESLNRYSLSTKMVTYLGSGLPILYHGPAGSAAGALLARNDAAQVCASLDPHDLAASLEALQADRARIVQCALHLARSQFSLSSQQRRFWKAFGESPDL